MAGADSGGNYNFGALEERVSGLEHGLSDVRVSIDGLAREVRDRQKFPWPAIWGGVSVLLVVVSMFGAVVIFGFMAYINGNTAGQDRLQTQLAAFIANSVSRPELDERRAASDARMDALEAQVLRITEGIVPRGEHEGHWQNQAASAENLQRQIDQMRNDFGSSFSLNDTLKALMERVDRLEQIRLEQSK